MSSKNRSENRENGIQEFPFMFQLIAEMLKGFEISIRFNIEIMNGLCFFKNRNCYSSGMGSVRDQSKIIYRDNSRKYFKG